MAQMSNEVSLKVAEVGDGAAILSLLKKVASVSSAFIVPNLARLTAKEEDEQLKQISQLPECLILLAVLDTQPIGILTVMPPSDALGRQTLAAVGNGLKGVDTLGELGIAVDPDYWHQGVGTLLVDEAKYWLANYSPLDALVLSVFDDNQHAIGLYQKAGFKKVDKTEEENRPATIMLWHP